MPQVKRHEFYLVQYPLRLRSNEWRAIGAAQGSIQAARRQTSEWTKRLIGHHRELPTLRLLKVITERTFDDDGMEIKYVETREVIAKHIEDFRS
jgi:hypothetical protein